MGRECYYMAVRHILALLMMITLTVVSGASTAAALCSHQNAQAHAAALEHADAHVAAAARLEDSAAANSAKRALMVDAGAFSLPAFILPPGMASPRPAAAEPFRPRPPDAAKLARGSFPPPLRPPSA
jgi:hypothetical protein